MQPRLVIIGFGAIGQRHLASARRLGLDVAILRRTEGDARATALTAGVPTFFSMDDAAQWGATHAVIATVTSAHADIAVRALGHGWHVLVEKPLAVSVAEGEAILSAAAAADRAVGVACNLRFHPALEAIADAVASGRLGTMLSARAEVGQYLPDWHPDRDYRTEYSAQGALGGGALLTLIHELDYLRWIAGPVRISTGWKARVSALEIDVDDVAEVLCRHESGAMTSVHMDFLDRAYHRRSRWIGSDATVDWQWGQAVTLLHPGGRRDVLWHDPGFDLGHTYVGLMDDFVTATRMGRSPRCSGADGVDVLRVVSGVEWCRS